MAHRDIPYNVVWRFVLYGAGLGLLCGFLFGLVIMPLIDIVLNSGADAGAWQGQEAMVLSAALIGGVAGACLGTILGAIMGLIVGALFGLLIHFLVNVRRVTPGNSFPLYGSIFCALVAILFCNLILLPWLGPLDFNAQYTLFSAWPTLIALLIMVLLCTWAGYRISAWVVKMYQQPVEVLDRPQ